MPRRIDLLKWATQTLTDAGRDAPRRSAEWLLMDVLGCDRVDLHLHAKQDVPAPEEREFRQSIRRRVAGEPLQHIVGYTEFYGLRIDVGPAVLVPRPETEEVVEWALQQIKGRIPASPAQAAPRVLDVGTGSGCIACALAHERPDAHVFACDVSEDALSVARANAARLDLDVRFDKADVLREDFPSHVPGHVDLLISNPPYVPSQERASMAVEVRDYDPALALFTGDDPTRFYRALAEHASTVCAPGGLLVVETHADYTDAVATVFRERGLQDVTTRTDLSGRPRMVGGVIKAEPQ